MPKKWKKQRTSRFKRTARVSTGKQKDRDHVRLAYYLLDRIAKAYQSAELVPVNLEPGVLELFEPLPAEFVELYDTRKRNAAGLELMLLAGAELELLSAFQTAWLAHVLQEDNCPGLAPGSRKAVRVERLGDEVIAIFGDVDPVVLQVPKVAHEKTEFADLPHELTGRGYCAPAMFLAPIGGDILAVRGVSFLVEHIANHRFNCHTMQEGRIEPLSEHAIEPGAQRETT